MPRDLFNFFVDSIKILVIWCISGTENHNNLEKNICKFQASVNEGALFLVGILECFGKTF